MVQVELGFRRAKWKNRVERFITEPWGLGEGGGKEGAKPPSKDRVHAADTSPQMFDQVTENHGEAY